MNLNVSRQKEYFLAQTDGPIDDTSRDPIREQLHPLVAEPGTKLIVDLSRSPRINSIGVGNLVTLVAHANTNGTRVIFCAIPSFVAVVLSVTKLDKYFEVAGTVEDAAAKLVGSSPA